MNPTALHPKDALYERVKDFLYEEVALIEDWRLGEWVNLYVPEGHYYLPALDLPDPETASPATSLFIVADDQQQLRARVRRVEDAMRMNGRSHTTHSLTNIRVLDAEDGVVRVRANFVVRRSRKQLLDTYFGVTYYRLVERDGRFRILEKRVCLAAESLSIQGSGSAIL